MHIACLDTESTSTGSRNEILELSIYDGRGQLIHNQLYKPRKVKKWPYSERVHGISPIMVQDKPFFDTHISKVGRIFQRSRMILGFAVDNDIRVLERYGFEHLWEKAFDVRDLYWAVKGEEKEFDYFHVPRLVICAEDCGFQWGEGTAHSAAADAEATLYCFRVLIRQYALKYQLFELQDGELSDQEIFCVWQHLDSMVAEELHRRAVEKARGWLYLMKRAEGYYVMARKHPLPVPKNGEEANHKAEVVDAIELPDSQKGYEDILARFAPCICGGENYYKALYNLSQEHIDFFKEYTNEFIDEKYVAKEGIKSYN